MFVGNLEIVKIEQQQTEIDFILPFYVIWSEFNIKLQ